VKERRTHSEQRRRSRATPRSPSPTLSIPRSFLTPPRRKTLKDLNLEYLDLYLIHFPIPLKYVPIETRYPPEWTYEPDGKMVEPETPYTIGQTWAAMERLVELGLVRNIGVANFNTALLLEISKTAKIAPQVNQVSEECACHMESERPANDPRASCAPARSDRLKRATRSSQTPLCSPPPCSHCMRVD